MVTGVLLGNFLCQEAHLARGRLDYGWEALTVRGLDCFLCHLLGLRRCPPEQQDYALSRLPQLVSFYPDLMFPMSLPSVLQIYLTFNYFSQADLDFQLAWKSNSKLPL